MKQRQTEQVATTATDDERRLERELRPLLEQQSELQNRANKARRAIGALEMNQPSLAPDVRLSAKTKKENAESASRLSSLKAEIVELERELQTVVLRARAISGKLNEVRQATRADRERRYDDLLREALNSAAEAQGELVSRERKLFELRKQSARLEAEIHALQTGPPTLNETAEDRARILLETGSMPSVAVIENTDTRTREMLGNQRTLQTAIGMQQRAVEEARTMLLRKVATYLKPAMQDVVRRIAEGYALASAATADAARLRLAFGRVTGNHDYLPCFVFQRIPAPLLGVQEDFSFWLDDMRRAGFEV